MKAGFWRNRQVLITGHTGFKGSWLTLWLDELGAEVHGYALEPPTTPSLFRVARLADCLSGHVIGDVRDPSALNQAMRDAEPEIVFHLAAQPLVRAGYADPVATYAVNVMGTVHLLEAVRRCPSVRAVVVVTSDKCYDNREWLWPYRENDALGGHDPYSSSKAAAELVTQAYRSAFLAEAGIQVASARAGNVIGGGDWARDRLIPDVLRALDHDETLWIRSPWAVRPWQHVLESLSGYLTLAERLYQGDSDASGAWNFGPDAADTWSVERLAQWFAARSSLRWQAKCADGPPESTLLALDSSRARARLGWQPRWSLDEALERTLAWHQAWRAGADMQAVTRGQIRDFE